MKKNFQILITAVMIACFITVGVQLARPGTTAQVSTDRTLYSVGANMVISGTGFTPGAYVYVTVQRPDQLVDSITPTPLSNSTGAFSVTYTPPLEPGRYKITATDGTNTATTALTQADAVGFNKNGYVKGTIVPEDQTGNWSSGNQGSEYTENQWTFDQYEIDGISSTADVPSFDVFFNHFQSSTNAVFIDALANFRACVDCTSADGAVNSGPDAGMLDDTHPLPPPGDTANWVVLPVGSSGVIRNVNRPLNSAADGSGSAVLSGSSGFCSSNTVKEPVNTPAEFHCFHVDGPSLAALFATKLNSGGSNHTISISYNGHLAASFVWGNGTAGVGGHEGLVGDCSTIYYARPYTSSSATEHSSFEPQTGNACSGTGIPIYGTDAYTGWNKAFFGVGFASGSSRHWSMANQTSGPSGAIEIPIPTVAAPSNTIVIVKQTVPSNATATFSYTGSLGPFSLSNPFPSSKTFTGIAAGVEYDVTETALAGWTLTNLNCAVTAGTDDGTGSWPTNTTNSTAAITLGATDSNVTLTCTYTNTGTGHIIVKKHTNPSGSAQSFAYTTTGTGYTGFSLIDGGTNTDGGTPPANGLAPGSYSVSETAVAGWTLTNRTCAITTTGSGTSTFNANGATATSSITLGAGDTVTCDYYNSQPDANVSITPLNPVNEVGNAETFTITVNAIPNGASPVVFTSITPSVTPSAGLTSNTNTCASPVITNGGNTATCTLTINSTTVGSYTAHVAAVITIGGVALNRATGDSNAGDSADGVKHYVDANITIGPATATNEVNQPHTFNIVVTALPDGTGTPTFGTVTATVTPTPGTLTVGAVTCLAPVGNTENCSFTINSSAAGTFTANACTDVTMGGVTVHRCTNDSHVGDVGPAVKNYILSATTLAFNSALSTPNTKTGAIVEAGSTATIVVTETNTGSNTINSVTVTGSPCANWTAPGGFSGSLAAGASANFTCTFIVAAGTNSWSAAGHGIDSLGNPVSTTGETDSGSFFGDQSSTSLTFNTTLSSPNTATGGTVEAGATVTVVLTETNTGNNTLTGVSVTGGGKCASFTGGLSTLTAGQSTNFTCTFVASAGTNAWNATGHATDSAGQPVSTAGETANGSVFGDQSTTTLVTQSAPSSVEFGNLVTIVVRETNTGNNTLTGVSVTGGGACSSGFTGGATTLAPGAFTDFTCTFTAVLGANAWTADGNGTDSLGNPVPTGAGTTEHAFGTVTGLGSYIIVNKISHSATATFDFSTTGFDFPGGVDSLTTVAGALGTTAPSGGATTGPILVHTGTYSVGEPTQPASWQLDASICTVDGTNPFGTATVVGGVNESWTFTIPLNTTVTCTFDDSIVLQTTRTQGFWATHTTLANTVWNGGTIPSGPVSNPVINPADPSIVGSPDSYLCGVQITALAVPAENVLMGGFWSNVSKKSTGSKRLSIDQLRMQMVQQYLAAVLNYHMFGSIGESVLQQARTDYCGSNAAAIQADIGLLGNLNQQGDSQPFTPGVSATAQASKSQADIDAWDTPIHPVD